MSKLAHSNQDTMDNIERLHLLASDLWPTEVVPKYDGEFCLMHPLAHKFLKAIGDVHARASKERGFYETWMAVYNECIHQGVLAREEATRIREAHES